MRDKLNCDISPAEYEMIFERLLERGEIPVSENLSYKNELIIKKKVYAEYNRLKMIDLETMSKYRIGDRVRDIDTGWIGTVIGDKYGGEWNYLVAYDENEETKGDNECYAREEDIEFVDKKQAFIERLRELMGMFDAQIEVRLDCFAREIAVFIVDDDEVVAGQTITAASLLKKRDE